MFPKFLPFIIIYCCAAVENLSRNRTRIVFQTKGVINDDERQTNGDKNGRNPKRRIRIRNEAKERRLAIFDSNIKNEHVPAGHTTNRSRGMKVLDTEWRYSGGNSRRTGADIPGRGWDSRCPMDLLLSSLLLLTAGNDNGKSCSVYSGAHGRRKT